MSQQKRIGFLVSSQTLIPHGGIGQYAKSFVELMTSYGHHVDIITDKNPQNVSDSFLENINANIIYPDNSYRYTEHSGIFMYEDSYCYERMANFRNSIIKALSRNIYDVLICNTYETVQVASTMGLNDYIQIIAYTHLESQIVNTDNNPFTSSVNEMMRQQLNMSGLYIGTQSIHNKCLIEHDNTYHLPIPLSEKALLQEYHKKREGVLFVGRWEEGKNPELYIELIKQTKLPARVMTSKTGKEKFENKLKELGVDYIVKAGITGKEKVDFMTSCRVAFNPSKVESYGLAFYEQMIQMPTFALDGQFWTDNFNRKHFFTTNKKTMAEDITRAYDEFDEPSKYYKRGMLARAIADENAVYHMYMECYNDFIPRKSTNNTAKICSETTVCYRDYIDNLNRDVICIDDVKSVLSNKHKFHVIYTRDDTYLTKEPDFVPPVSIRESLDFFEVANG